MPPSSSSSSSSSLPVSKSKRQNPNPSNPTSFSSCCNHSSPAATLDLLILILVLFSCSFLVLSSLSHLLRVLSQTLTLSTNPLSFLLSFLLLLLLLLPLLRTSRFCSRKCRNPRCKGLKKALEFDVQIQTEDCVREKGKVWKEIEDLPWKGGQQGRNPDYEVLRAELRKMAPLNGRAVLLFRARCGCPLAKLEAWGPKKGPRRSRR
ncbi:uncharacterized protein A4U43_C07F8680 [Asparagus officinalis]|uniref:Ribosomal protein L34e superfamily protein n=2 Tax=Asparagus officinalis TaxID=4686 RepID=A0A5P1EDQ7_ASPOF|nr:uncharacterized protein A4U43_C07F8680 [Asparagus officinalis]